MQSARPVASFGAKRRTSHSLLMTANSSRGATLLTCLFIRKPSFESLTRCFLGNARAGKKVTGLAPRKPVREFKGDARSDHPEAVTEDGNAGPDISLSANGERLPDEALDDGLRFASIGSLSVTRRQLEVLRWV